MEEEEQDELTNILNNEFNKSDISLLNDEESFLKNIYNLNDFESGMLYINNNKYLSIFTVNRILLLMLNNYINDNYFPNNSVRRIWHLTGNRPSLFWQFSFLLQHFAHLCNRANEA